MDAEIKAKWLARLRSGLVKQGYGSLVDEHEGRCCLGVLGEVQGIDLSKPGPNPISFGLPPGTAYEEFPRLSIDHLAGVTAPQCGTLMQMNDGDFSLHVRRHTFSEIADWIEENA